MRRALLFVILFLACALRPPRPYAPDPRQARELDQCDYLYSQCLGKPDAMAPSDWQPDPLDWRGEPQANCNRCLKNCYERVISGEVRDPSGELPSRSGTPEAGPVLPAIP